MKDPHHIIAIGASAGGMEELNVFFENTPLDGVTYIVIQHLSAEFKSRMADLLARHSKLIVEETVNGLKIQANHVYLIPNDQYMTISGLTLWLKAKKKDQAPHLTINTFFNSLAESWGDKAIAVILSGLGSDGTEGVRAVKGAGGMVIARNPENTKFASMPSNAISTGLVDFILEPEQMPHTIENFINYGLSLTFDQPGDNKYMEAILELIKENSSFDFTQYKKTTLLRRTKRRVSLGHFAGLESYLTYLQTSPDELEALTKDFLISVTSFFRDPEAFDMLERTVWPELLKNLTKGEELKIWVAGCATGEEAYSLAIALDEQMTRLGEHPVVKIFATDLDEMALALASDGLYSDDIGKDVSIERLEQYFIQEGDKYRIKPVIRKMLIFARHDLVKNPPYCNMSLISCRNILIYMSPVLQKKVYSVLLFGLKTGGYLFLGSSENPATISSSMTIIDPKWKIYKNLDKKRFLSYDGFSLPELSETKKGNSLSSSEPLMLPSPGISDLVAEAIVREQNYLVVCINEQNKVIKSYGDTSNFLLQKNFTQHLPELLPRSLAIAFNAASLEAKAQNISVTVDAIRVKEGQKVRTVRLTIQPLTNKKNQFQFLMVTFRESSQPADPEGLVRVFDETIFFDQYTQNLEDELEQVQIKLTSAQEQIDASNENMQSFNEELLSANEEMQSTNEEMQSVNEELDTINLSYQTKNKELLELNDDLNNYFRSTINGQLFIDNDMRLLKFSPGATQQINLLESDIGRPLSHISTNIKFETMLEDIKKVLSDGSVVTKQIETNDGKAYQLMTMPYIRFSDNKRSGAIITFNDVTELMRVEKEIELKNQSLQRVNADLDNFVLAASHDLLGPLANIEVSISVMNEIKVVDPDLQTILKIINTSIIKFRGLLKSIGTIAKIESGVGVQEKIQLTELLDHVEWSLENVIKASGATLVRQLAVPEILFSKNNLRSILYNLVSNAIKFKSDRPPLITISTYPEENRTVLCIEDNGIGMNAGDTERIFSMYGRLKDEVEGQGMGLYLAKKIINASEGKIEVQSEVGVGSKFLVYFK